MMLLLMLTFTALGLLIFLYGSTITTIITLVATMIGLFVGPIGSMLLLILTALASLEYKFKFFSISFNLIKELFIKSPINLF